MSKAFKIIANRKFPQKIIALIIAIGIWATAAKPTQDKTREIQFTVPLSFINLDRDHIITSRSVESIAVTADIGRLDYLDISPTDFQVRLDLKKIQKGTQDYEIKKEDIVFPNETSITFFSPPVITLNIDKIIDKEVPVQPIFNGKPLNDYVLAKTVTTPSTLKIRGPSAVLDPLQAIVTEPINIAFQKYNFKREVSVILPSKVQLVEGQILGKNITLTVEISSTPENKRIDNISLSISNQEYLTRINPKQINVLLRGPKSVIETIDKNDVKGMIDLTGLKPGNYKIKKPVFFLPTGVSVEKNWPPIDIWILNQRVYED